MLLRYVLYRKLTGACCTLFLNLGFSEIIPREIKLPPQIINKYYVLWPDFQIALNCTVTSM